MIRSGDYQYVYGINRDPAAEKCAFYGCCVHKTYISPEPFEANTGYYYISAHNKSRAVRALFRAALSECARRPAMDDQTNFWSALRQARGGNATGAGAFKRAYHCKKKGPRRHDADTLNYCCLDTSAHDTVSDLPCNIRREGG